MLFEQFIVVESEELPPLAFPPTTKAVRCDVGRFTVQNHDMMLNPASCYCYSESRASNDDSANAGVNGTTITGLKTETASKAAKEKSDLTLSSSLK